MTETSWNAERMTGILVIWAIKEAAAVCPANEVKDFRMIGAERIKEKLTT